MTAPGEPGSRPVGPVPYPVRDRATCMYAKGGAESARPSDLANRRPGPEPGPVPGSPRRRRRCRRGSGTVLLSAVEVTHHHRWRRCVTGAGARTSEMPADGAADSAVPVAPTGGGEPITTRASTRRRCARSEPMSTAESGPPSATPNWSRTVRDNRRQPPTTSAENSSRRISSCGRASVKAHRNPITYVAIEAEGTRDNRYNGDIGDQPISV